MDEDLPPCMCEQDEPEPGFSPHNAAMIRKTVHKCLDALPEYMEVEEPAFCVGWFLIAEYMQPGGSRALRVVAGDLNDTELPQWTSAGYLAMVE